MKTFIQRYKHQRFQESILLLHQMDLISSMRFMLMLKRDLMNIKQPESIGGNILTGTMLGTKENLGT